MDSLVKLMRYNNYQTDPLSKCDCTPPYSANAAIAARGDLNLPNGKYPFNGLGFEDMGAIDFKAANLALVKQFKFRAISGPTHDDVPIFDWTTSSLKDKVRHFGQPAIWNFTAVEYDLAKLQPTP